MAAQARALGVAVATQEFLRRKLAEAERALAAARDALVRVRAVERVDVVSYLDGRTRLTGRALGTYMLADQVIAAATEHP
jgi:hypothetical protein